MGPKDNKHSTETNGSSAAAGKGRKAGWPDDFEYIGPEELTQDDHAKGKQAGLRLSRMIRYFLDEKEMVYDFEKAHGRAMLQQERINELEKTLDDVVARRDRDMGKLREENDLYQEERSEFEKEREQLRHEQTMIDEHRRQLEDDLRKANQKEIEDIKQQMSEKLKSRAREIRKDCESKLHSVQKAKEELESAVKALEEEKRGLQQGLKKKTEDFDVDKESLRTKIKMLNLELRDMNALSTASLKDPDF